MSESIEILKELISLNSENPPGNTKTNIEWIQNWGKENGITVKTQWYKKNSANIVLSYGKSPKSVVMCGHLDTVPVGDRSNWRVDPFGADEKDGYIYGRGSADMKGGVSACLAALKSVKETVDEDKLEYSIVFLGTSDEEVGLSGANAAMELGIMDSAEFLIVAEPTSLNVGIAEKGVLWLIIHSFGKAAHGSTPEKGINAIEELVKLFPLLKEMVPNISHPILGKSTLNIGIIKGGKSANVVPEEAEVHCDYRLVPPIEPANFAKQIESRITDVMRDSSAKFKVYINQIMPPVFNSQNNELIQLFMEESRSQIPIGLNYGTDAAVLVHETSVPFIIYGPGDPKAIHIANERVPIAEVLEVETVLVNFLKRIAAPFP